MLLRREQNVDVALQMICNKQLHRFTVQRLSTPITKKPGKSEKIQNIFKPTTFYGTHFVGSTLA